MNFAAAMKKASAYRRPGKLSARTLMGSMCPSRRAQLKLAEEDDPFPSAAPLNAPTTIVKGCRPSAVLGAGVWQRRAIYPTRVDAAP